MKNQNKCTFKSQALPLCMLWSFQSFQIAACKERSFMLLLMSYLCFLYSPELLTLSFLSQQLLFDYLETQKFVCLVLVFSFSPFCMLCIVLPCRVYLLGKNHKSSQSSTRVAKKYKSSKNPMFVSQYFFHGNILLDTLCFFIIIFFY